MSEPKKVRALSMFSGGLDSLLATRLLANLGVEVLALHFTAPFIDPHPAAGKGNRAAQWAERLGVPLRIVDVWPGFLEIIRAPRYGHGKNLNPCVDCKIHLLARAREIMTGEGFDFVFTGEVLGQRPMSQQLPSLQIIAQQSGLADRLLRPLSAKLLEPTRPELEGLVDRDKLLAFSGRGRKPQLALATELGIADPPGSAGGCLLTDHVYSQRLRHLLALKTAIGHDDLYLLNVGRHLALPGGAKVIVSRNEQENHAIQRHQAAGTVLLEPLEWPGPTALLVGSADPASLETAAALMKRWGKPPAEARVSARFLSDRSERVLATALELDETAIRAMQIL
ncbi:MAG: hypothetical protein GX444_00255 [Myxococcales bacterium]|nr:hypothetical protein [Myxococcales bacterium]